MRILYIDIDTLRADHLGCYGYHRSTSPNIDRIAAQSVRFERCYASDVPCLPSRTALFSGRVGTRNGVVGHGGSAADPYLEGPSRGFSSSLGRTAWPALLRKQGLRTASISSFVARHGAHHFCAGLDELLSPGKLGLETADEVCGLASDWLARHAQRDAWFLHVHLWDPHTPYRAPASYGEPFADEPLPAWLTETIRARDFAGCGPHSAQEAVGFSPEYPYGAYPRQPRQIDSMGAVRRMFDGYDTGVRFADDQIGQLLDTLDRLDVLEDTALLISADHGETLGELNVYGDHHTADEHTAHVPCLLRWPGLAARSFDALCYQVDVAATVVELASGRVPSDWDGISLAGALRDGENADAAGRSALVITQGAWTCQRAVRWSDYLAIRTWHDGYHDYDAWMLFDLVRDPHEQHNLAAQRPDLIRSAERQLTTWLDATRQRGNDPLQTVLAEGGPWHTRGKLPAYLERLRATGRAACADRLAAAHPSELAS